MARTLTEGEFVTIKKETNAQLDRETVARPMIDRVIENIYSTKL